MAKIKKQKYVKHKNKKTSTIKTSQNVASNKNNITINLVGNKRASSSSHPSSFHRQTATTQQQQQLQQLQQLQPMIQYRTPNIINTKTYNEPGIAPPDKQYVPEVAPAAPSAAPPAAEEVKSRVVDKINAIENSLHRLHETIKKEDVNASSLGMRQPIVGFNAPKKVEPTKIPTSREEYEGQKQSLMTSFISEKPRAEPAPQESAVNTPTADKSRTEQAPAPAFRTPIAEAYDRNFVADGDDAVVVRATKVYSRSDPYPNRNTKWFNTIPVSERDKIYQWKSIPAHKRGTWREAGLMEPPNLQRNPSKKDGTG